MPCPLNGREYFPIQHTETCNFQITLRSCHLHESFRSLTDELLWRLLSSLRFFPGFVQNRKRKLYYAGKYTRIIATENEKLKVFSGAHFKRKWL